MKITIDGRTIEAAEGATILEAAETAGIEIPHLCYSPGIECFGACRLCVCKVEGFPKLMTACTTTVSDGMVVQNDVEEVNKTRRMICEMLIADHPDDCLSCTGNQHCGLQNAASFLGIRNQRLREIERPQILDESNPFYRRDLSRCILCGLCTRTCQERRFIGAIDIAGRGYESRISCMGDAPVSESNCVSCGECVDRCPTRALAVKNEVTPPTATTKTICPYCGCGCGIDLGTRNQKIVKISGDMTNPVSTGSLCVKGHFGLDFVNSPDRLTKPLIRKNGKLEEAEWDEALTLVADKLSAIKAKHGPDAIGGFSSAKCTNEENYVFQKLIRSVVGTNNVDHCARLCHASTVAGLARAFGSGAMTNSIDELEHADCILVTGSNTTEAHPIISLRIKAAVERHGATLIVADPRKIDLVPFAKIHVRQRSGTDVAFINALLNVIIAEDLLNREFIDSRTECFDDVIECVKDCTPEWAEPITGVPADKIREIARTYAGAERGSIVYSMGITQHTTGTDNVLSLANLAMITGHIGRLSTGVNPLRGQNNVQGACDLGALPNVYPGYQKVDDPAIHAKFEEAWDTKLSDKIGMTVTEMIPAAAKGELKAIYVMGENPMLSDPNLNHVKTALENLEFLVVQDIFLTETAEMADVVLPAASFAEKDGSFTNTERRVQRVRTALPAPGEARQDWEIICEIGTRLGQPMSYDGPGAILDEIASVSPMYGGMSFDRIEGEGLCWPCPDKSHPGTTFLHEDEFKRGKGKFHPVPFRAANENPCEEFPYLLTTGRYLYHFHTRTMTGRSPGLEELCPAVPFEIHPEDAEREGLAQGDVVSISSRRGTIEAWAKVTDRSPKGSIFMAFHFKEGAANVLTNDAIDPIAKIPEFKVCAVKLDKK